ncbi:hypothetical protein PHMEG_00024561 [Phytophthora megakarya]|uniref:Tyr recombinase domain-containing protein n=1 Tax=Phytophthora megakarya TaxID=4795 RepID=A0A225VFW2_9STRA|nr:hypothetical protein PHMEG_00024561 [Phytophthora megakarya]
MLNAEDMSKILKIAAIETGLSPHKVSCHSLRSGGASALIAGGADSTIIKFRASRYEAVELTLQSLSSTEGGGQVRFSDIPTIRKKLEHHPQQ